MSGPVDLVLSRLGGVKQTPGGWMALCPAHEDGTPSLSVKVGDDGRVLLHCHAKCTTEAVVAAMGLKMGDLFPPRSTQPGRSKPRNSKERGTGWASLDEVIKWILGTLGSEWRHARTHEYRADLVVLRFERSAGEKTFRPATSEDGRWSIQDPRGKWPLYRASSLKGAPRVYVNEGEKAAEAAAAIGLPATCSSHGADAAEKTDWADLAGKEVVVLQDNDVAGRGYGRAVGEILVHLRPPARVWLVSLPGLPEHGDIVEYIAAAKEQGLDDAAIRAAIEQAVAATEPFVGLGSAPGGGNESFWPDPDELPDELLPVAGFDYALLPLPLQACVRDIAERMQCPPEFVAVPAMIALATIVGRRIGIRPKQHDDWLVITNLWGAVVGRPGVLKTPAIAEALRTLRELEKEARLQYQKDAKRAEAEALIERAKRKEGEKEIRESLREDKDPFELAFGMVNAESNRPTRVRFLVYDSTVEKLGELLNENPNGLLCFRDELIGLLLSLDKEGQEGARSFYLEAWAGTNPYTYDRIGRGTIDITSTTLSLLGSIQPGKLIGYLEGATQLGNQDDGLVQRLQLLVWPDITATWHLVDRPPNLDARARADKVYRDILARSGVELGGELEVGDKSGIPFTRFDPAAQTLFNEWFSALEIRIRGGEEHPSFESHLSKYRSLVPSLALLIHIAEGHGGQVGKDALERAIGWVRYLESHAERVYGFVTRPENHAARCLAARILRGALPDGFDARSVYRKGWSGLTRSEQVESALQVLAGLNWVREVVDTKTGGAPATTWSINPKLLLRAKQGTDKADRSPGTDSENAARPREGTDKTDTSAEIPPKSTHPQQQGTDKADTSGPSVGSVGADSAEPENFGDDEEDAI